MELIYITGAEAAKTKKGKVYFRGFMVCIREGGSQQVALRIWDVAPKGASPDSINPPNPGFYNAKVDKVDEFNGELQIHIDWASLKWVDADMIDENERRRFSIMPPFAKNYDDGLELQRMIEAVESIEHEPLRLLAMACLSMVDYRWSDKWSSDNFPASTGELVKTRRLLSMWGGRKLHHAYYSGWLSHTMEVMNIALDIHQRMLDHGKHRAQSKSLLVKQHRDLIIAGAALHDIGKAWENDESQGFQCVVTKESRILGGHMQFSLLCIERVYRMIEEEIDSPPLSPEWHSHLVHIVEAHHGSYGSVLPRTIPAHCVQKADGVSCELSKIRDNLLLSPSENDMRIYGMGGSRLQVVRVLV